METEALWNICDMTPFDIEGHKFFKFDISGTPVSFTEPVSCLSYMHVYQKRVGHN